MLVLGFTGTLNESKSFCASIQRWKHCGQVSRLVKALSKCKIIGAICLCQGINFDLAHSLLPHFVPFFRELSHMLGLKEFRTDARNGIKTDFYFYHIKYLQDTFPYLLSFTS